MDDITPLLQRVGQLCASLDSDPELRDELERCGFSADDWDTLAVAIRTGSAQAISELLDAVERAATTAGLDGVTYPTREFRRLPDGFPAMYTVSGWRCPHPNRCGRVYPATDSTDTHKCAATGVNLTWISVDSR